MKSSTGALERCPGLSATLLFLKSVSAKHDSPHPLAVGLFEQTYGGEPGTLQATFTNTTFAGNRCGGWGGGLYAFTNHIGTVTLADVKFSNNSALYVVYGNPGSYVGGAFFGSGRGLSTEAEDCVFESNVAGWGGGAVFIESGSFNATRTIFRGNLAHWHDGGAIVASVDDSSSDEPPPARIVLWDVQMESNWAAREGGGIAAKDRSEVRIQGSLLKDNTARSGGALSVSGGAVVLSEDSNFTKNSAAVRFTKELEELQDRVGPCVARV